MKKCIGTCGETKELSEYYLNTNGKPINTCKVCTRARVSKRSNKIASNDKIIVNYKACYDCGKEKAADQFPNNKYRIDGLGDECKSCSRIRARSVKGRHASGELHYKLVEQKPCTNCKVEKPIIQFNKNKTTADGYGTECKECMAEYGEKYKEDNKGYFDTYMAKYRINNYEKFIGYSQQRKAQIASTTIKSFSRGDVILLYGNKCFYCNDGLFEHLDHYIPLSKGGSHTMDNVRPSCSYCNLSKNAKLPEEWYKYLEKKKAIGDRENGKK